MTILDRLRHLLSCSICVCVSATVFRRLCFHMCCSSSHLCCSICVRIGVAASVFHLCCSVCVSASMFLHLFSIHNRLPSMTTLIICVIFAVAIFPTPSISKAYTPLFLLLRRLGNPYRWITCVAFNSPRKEMIVYLWSLISFQIWPSSQPPRRTSK